MIWYVEGSAFFLAFTTILTGTTVVLFGYCLKSRCKKCVCCSKDNWLEIERDSLAENEELKMELDHIPFMTKNAENNV
jgi:hypothetical protein